MIIGSVMTAGLAIALTGWLLVARPSASPALAAAADTSALALVDRGLSGPAGPDDEGQYRLIDPIGPGGATATGAQDEVFSSTMVGGLYTKWQPYHDPFTGGGSVYGRRDLDVLP